MCATWPFFAAIPVYKQRCESELLDKDRGSAVDLVVFPLDLVMKLLGKGVSKKRRGFGKFNRKTQYLKCCR